MAISYCVAKKLLSLPLHGKKKREKKERFESVRKSNLITQVNVNYLRTKSFHQRWEARKQRRVAVASRLHAQGGH